MVRKILLGIVALLILAGAGTYMLIKTKGDVLLQKFSAYVEETTGAPLLMDELPTLTFFPQPGLNLGRASWGREESALSVRFERASVRVSAKSLLRGKLDITDMEVDGLAVVSRSAAAKAAPAAAPASSAAPAPVSDKNEAKDAARLEAVLTRILTVAPNALTVRDGHVSLLRSDGASTEFSHVDLNLKNVRPGADTGLTLKADIRGLGPDFSGVLELTAGAALSDSNLTVSLRKAVFTPTAGLPFDTPLSLSGDGNYQLRNGSLTLRSLTLSGPDLHVTASGDAAALPALLRDPLHAAGPASLEFSAKGSPRAVLAALALPVPDSDPAALTAAALTGRLDMIGSAQNGWYQVQLSNGAKGFVSAQYVSFTKPAAPAPTTRTGYSTGSNVNVRKSASTSAAVLTTLSRGQSFTVIGSAQNGWYQVQLSNGVKGFVSAKYVKLK